MRSWESAAKKSIDTAKLYEAYRGYVKGGVDFESFLNQIAPIFNRHYTRYEGVKFTKKEYRDLFQDVSLKVFMFIRYNSEIDHPGKLYNALDKTVRNALLDKLNFYNPKLISDSSDDLEDLHSTYGSPNQMFKAIHFRDLIKILVEKFQREVRFRGDERKLCFHIFNKIMSKDKINRDYLELKYKSKNVKFFIHYTQVVARMIVRELALQDRTELQDVI